MYRKYRIVECIASSVSQYESYRDQVDRYTPSEVLWHSPQNDFMASAQAIILYEFENYTSKFTATSPRVQWVKLNIATPIEA